MRRVWLAPRSYRPLERVRVLVYDEQSLQVAAALLQRVSYAVFHSRGEVFHAHPRVLWRGLKYAIKFRSLSLSYHAAVIDARDPEIVLTFIDNDGVFHELANRFPGKRFIAIQNGWRFPNFDDYSLQKAYDYRSIMLCFGENDADNYGLNGTSFARIKAIGSIKNALWRQTSQQSEGDASDEVFDLCFVSTFRYEIPLDSPYMQDVKVFMDQVVEYLRERPSLRVAVALFYREDVFSEHEALMAEKEFFQKWLSPSAMLFPNDSERTSVYRLTDRCAVNISYMSAASIEAAARGNRTLMNMPGSLLDFEEAQRPPWFLFRASYEDFSIALDSLLAMSDETFKLQYGSQINYFVVNSGNSSALFDIEQLVLGVESKPVGER
jgi:surface carbohydrate biosynthesis protein